MLVYTPRAYNCDILQKFILKYIVYIYPRDFLLQLALVLTIVADQDPDPLVRGTDPDPLIIKQK